jgi:anti-sigma regulatory factor (Ser/Thr protein kinase)
MILKISLTRNDPYQLVLEKKSAEFKKLLHLHERDFFEINLILDEICTNIFEHNSKAADLFVEIEVQCKDDLFQMVIIDNGVPFKPTSVAAPKTDLPLEERQPGGLGLMLIKKYSKKISYKRLGDLNKITVTKKLR